jgi:hypothetical protein
MSALARAASESEMNYLGFARNPDGSWRVLRDDACRCGGRVVAGRCRLCKAPAGVSDPAFCRCGGPLAERTDGPGKRCQACARTDDDPGLFDALADVEEPTDLPGPIAEIEQLAHMLGVALDSPVPDEERAAAVAAIWRAAHSAEWPEGALQALDRVLADRWDPDEPPPPPAAWEQRVLQLRRAGYVRCPCCALDLPEEGVVHRLWEQRRHVASGRPR